jgi:hypothetical protein
VTWVTAEEFNRMTSLISRRKFAERLDVHKRTVIRREREDPNFPRAVIINGYRYFINEAEADAYVAELIRKGIDAPIETPRAFPRGKVARSKVA